MERLIERGLFASRWFMAPMYVGLVGALAVLLYTFGAELVHLAMKFRTLTADDAVLGVLSLIDISLAGNLILIVIFSGYENFVKKIELEDTSDRLAWQGTVDFAGLKLKLVASMVAISGIHLLKIFMDIEKYQSGEIMWMVIIHLVFVLSGVFLALMDLISANSKATRSLLPK